MSFGVSIGDFISVLTLANKLRRDFVGAPSQFNSISRECVDIVHLICWPITDDFGPTGSGGWQLFSRMSMFNYWAMIPMIANKSN